MDVEAPLGVLKRPVAALLLAGVLFVGACGDDARLDTTSRALSTAADACLIDVRDHGRKYEQSRNCAALGTLSGQYIEAGGFRTTTPAKYEAVAQAARATAWAARAVSATGNPALSIW